LPAFNTESGKRRIRIIEMDLEGIKKYLAIVCGE